MQYFAEKGLTHKETIEKIKTKYGDQAKIMTFKTVRMGGFLGLGVKEGIEMSGYVQPEPVKRKVGNLDEEKRKILEAAGTVARNQEKAVSLNDLFIEIKELKEKVGSHADGPVNGTDKTHPNLAKLKSLLIKNEFSELFISHILDVVRRQFTLDSLENYDLLQKTVVDLIGGNLTVQAEPDLKSSKVIIIIGPTGVGKTTTIAKLAAVYGRIGTASMKPVDVRIITADNYRIGAVNQLEVYGKIMEIPFANVDSKEELRKRLEMFADARLILVDTSGRSPKNYASLGEMQELLEECRSFAGARDAEDVEIEYHLALSATTKTADLHEILRQFESFDYRSVILTKLDETMRIGNVLSALWEKKKSVSFITFGQGVPSDISAATVPELLKYLEGFHIDWEHVHEKYVQNR